MTKKQMNEYKRAYKHLNEYEIREIVAKYKTERGAVAKMEKINAERVEKAAKPLPIFMAIEVNWSVSRVWGMNPHVSLRYEDEAGELHYIENAGGASGCGYDKLSAAIADAMNDNFYNLRVKANGKLRRCSLHPYGIGTHGGHSYFERGVGMNSVRHVFEWLGYDFAHVAESKQYDKFTAIKKGCKRRFAV